MPHRIVVAVVVLIAGLACTSAATAFTITPPRVSPLVARETVQYVFGTLAGAIGERLVITPCAPLGKRGRTCVARIGRDRYRVNVASAPENQYVTSVHRLRPAARR